MVVVLVVIVVVVIGIVVVIVVVNNNRRVGNRKQRIFLLHAGAENDTRWKVLVTVMELMMMVGLVLICSWVLPEKTR